MVTDVRPEHLSKAELLISVTLEGITKADSSLQPENAFSPIVVTLAGIVMEDRLSQL